MADKFWLTALAVPISLTPGILSWLSGIRLMRFRDDPALPERLLARRLLIFRVTLVASLALIVLPGSAAWKVPLVALSLALGNFPIRRRVFEEQWGFGAYVLFLVRLAAAFWGFWLLLGLSPSLVQATGPWRWVVASILAAALLSWCIFHPAVFVWLMRGRPFSSPPLFDQVMQSTRIRPPLLVRLADSGARFANAMALASLWRPTVAFTDRFFTLLTPEEQAAVYAHEIAHLEDATQARLWRADLSQCSAVLIGTFVPAALPTLSPGVLAAWWLMVLLWLSYRNARSRTREEHSDRRAVELLENPDGLVRALVKLHEYALVPRRLDIDVERDATHPSLARRIQSIRRFAGLAAAPEPAVVFPLSRPRGFVIFAGDKIAWLEGVPLDSPADPDVLLAQATRTQEIPYRDLIELRVKDEWWSKPKIIATDKTGRVQTFPVRPADLASIQAVLDRVDLHLAPPPPALQFELLLFRLFLVGLLFFVIWTPRPGNVIMVDIFLAALLPVPTSLAMLTTASAAHAFAVLITFPYSRHPEVGLVVGVVMALAVAWEARRLASRAVYRSKLASFVLPIVLGGAILVAAWGWTYINDMGLDWELLDVTNDVHPDVWIAPASFASGLWSLRSRGARAAAFFFFMLAFLLLAIGKGLPISSR